ncbi:PREDICTED: bestrophin-2-like [Diuraphis noxia]|uniref:bestrophin-2-like n=1 Tax=Diuraphis noxia TaxID=143948 RepID=UPI0007636B2E|nr:PREDICTED: bestrophin-2-like [Diuraphis noxia]
MILLIFRWRGSIYKLVWPDLAAFLVCYYTLNLTYRFVLNPQQKRIFESISDYCETYSDLIPLSFVLGFYISIIMQRWWDQYCSIPWPDPIAVYVSSHIHGQDERGRLMRRTIMRYVCLGLTMVFSNISPRVKKRFPTLDHFVEAGLLLENEKTIVLDLNDKFPRHSKHWLPVVWATSIVTRARKEGRIRDDFAVKTIIDELNTFRGQCGLLLNYDSISVPLVYTQVVTLAVYSFFITTVMGRQWLDKPVMPLANLKHQTESNSANYNYIDLYFPVFTTLQFFFYMGWLKVAESLINPFGEDDDDFEVNWIIDRNVQVSYLIVDEMHHEHPELIRDQYWDQVFPTELPYTVAAGERERHPEPSTANIAVSDADAEYSLPPKGCDDGQAIDDDDANSGIHFIATAGSYKRSNSQLRGRPMSSHSSNDHHHHPNNQSVASSLNRVGSVTSILKNLFKRTGGTSAQLAGDG